MEIAKIRNKWRLRENNKQASINLWDSMARSFGEYSWPFFDEDSFLKLVKARNMISGDTLVLDVGCGTGRYAIALAEKCKEVTGVDLSQKMINIAEKKAAEYRTGNVNFICSDWHSFNIKQEGFEKKFDLVFAHMTPAVQSAETFEKLTLASKGWCVLSKPTRRTDPVSDAVKALAEIDEEREHSDNDIIYAFELLWRQGFFPYLEYEKQRWHMEKTLPEAYGLYINRVKSYRDISQTEEEKLKQYLQSISTNGLVIEDVDTTITTLYWHV